MIIRTLLVFLFLILSYSLIAQIGGISASKISAYTVDVVDHHKVEFEPILHHLTSNSYWDNNGSLNHLPGDSIRFTTGLDFRVTYGLLDKFEIGNTFSSDLKLTSIGMRYVFYDGKKTGLAGIAGINIPLGNRTTTIRRVSESLNGGAGLVFTGYFNPNFSVDVNAQYLLGFTKTDEGRRSDLFINSDFGYYFFSKRFQVVAGFGYQRSRFDSGDSYIFTFYPGVTIETGKQYIIVVNSIVDLLGKDFDKSLGLALALTITLE